MPRGVAYNANCIQDERLRWEERIFEVTGTQSRDNDGNTSDFRREATPGMIDPVTVILLYRC